jgi:DNA polymerase-1
MKDLFVVDLMNLAFRGFYSHSELKTSAGVPTGMCYGVVKILQKILADNAPNYVVVATDAPGPTFRHGLYPLYKSNRNEKPVDFKAQMGTLYRIISAYGFPLVEQAGMEADDIIGSIARQFATPDVRVTVVSGDKDFMQLVDPNVRLLRVTNNGNFICDEEGVKAKFGCRPDQVVDVLAIMGDASDTVPGVKGIGPVGAGSLIQRFGSLEAVYDRLGDRPNNIAPNMALKLLVDKEMAFLSKSLVTIKCDVPLSFTLDQCANKGVTDELNSIFKELEFFSLLAGDGYSSFYE